MHHLIKSKYTYYLFTLTTIIFTFAILMIFSTYNIDKYFKGHMIVSELSDRKLTISSLDSYKIENKSSVKMLINERYYNSEIIKIGLNKNGKVVYIIKNKNIPLIENTTLPVTIIYGTETIMDKIISGI